MSDYSAPLNGSGLGTGGPGYPGTITDPHSRYTVVNKPTTAPRALASVYGIPTEVLEFSVIHNAHGIADTATFSTPVKNGPDWSKILRDPIVNMGAIICSVYAGFPSNPQSAKINIAQLTRRFVGILDPYEVKSDGQSWTFTCTSLASLLMSEKQTTISQNQTSQQYLIAVAREAGLNTSIRLGPLGSHKLSEVYAKQLVVGVHNVKPWTILESCAQVDDVDLWLSGDTIYYWTPNAEDGRPHIRLIYGRDLISFDGTHSPQNKNIEVEVRTWSPKQRISHITRYLSDGTVKTGSRRSITLPAFGTGGARTITENSDGGVTINDSVSPVPGGGYNSGTTSVPHATSKERLVFHIPGLTPDQADKRAYTIWLQISRAEYSAVFEAPITPQNLKYIGVGSCFELYGLPWYQFNTGTTVPTSDQAGLPLKTPAYFPRQIEETFNDSGWKFKATCVNHSTPPGSESSSFVGDTGI